MDSLQLQEGPQRQAAESRAKITIYGGAAGSGKTYFETFEAAKWYDDPTYGAVIFRRTRPELKGIGSIWDECCKIYPLLGGDLVETRLECTFPSGARVKLDGLEHEKDKLKYQGKSLGSVFFDEVTHFTETQFWYIISRVRGFKKGRIVGTCNPDPDSWLIGTPEHPGLISWYIGEDGYPIAERSGVIRWFARVGDDLQWFASKEEAIAAGFACPLEGTEDDDRYMSGEIIFKDLHAAVTAKCSLAMSFTFIAANIWDNPALISKDPGYLASLQNLPTVERARLLGGNWRVRMSAGDYFQEAWFPMRDEGFLAQTLAGHPVDDQIVRKIRCWDRAASPHKGDLAPGSKSHAVEGHDPDWTRGLLVGEFRDGRIVVLDLVSCRDSPGEVENLIKVTAEKDGRLVRVVDWQDPGQAGPYQVMATARLLRGIAQHEAIVARENKEEYALLPSRTAGKGRIFVQKGPWNRAFFDELTTFPKKKKDITDTLSLACLFIFEHPRSMGGHPTGVKDLPRERLVNDVRTTSRIRSL